MMAKFRPAKVAYADPIGGGVSLAFLGCSHRQFIGGGRPSDYAHGQEAICRQYPCYEPTREPTVNNWRDSE